MTLGEARFLRRGDRVRVLPGGPVVRVVSVTWGAVRAGGRSPVRPTPYLLRRCVVATDDGQSRLASRLGLVG